MSSFRNIHYNNVMYQNVFRIEKIGLITIRHSKFEKEHEIVISNEFVIDMMEILHREFMRELQLENENEDDIYL